jgi:hypothetical protein
MNRRIALISLIIIVCAGAVYMIRVSVGVASVPAAEEGSSSENPLDRYIDNVAFGPGEKLSFDINYGFINAGSATMEVEDFIEYNGRPCYQIVSTANSNKFFSSFYRVEDRVESIVDARGIYSWRFDKKLSEGNYRSHRHYEFDQLNNKVVYEKDTIEIAPFVQDALSVLYYVRTQNLKVGQSVFVENFTDGKKYTLEVKVHRRESIKVSAGKFDCLVVEPLLLTSGIFKHEGKLTVWLTDDRLKMPVLMKSKVLVGSISAELTGYKLGEILDF